MRGWLHQRFHAKRRRSAEATQAAAVQDDTDIKLHMRSQERLSTEPRSIDGATVREDDPAQREVADPYQGGSFPHRVSHANSVPRSHYSSMHVAPSLSQGSFWRSAVGSMDSVADSSPKRGRADSIDGQESAVIRQGVTFCAMGSKDPRLSQQTWRRTPLVVITDPGQDLDDEMTIILLRCLVELRLVDVRGIVANLYPSWKRALLCRGTVDMLGMYHVPIGIGTDGGDIAGKHGDAFKETAFYIAGDYSTQALSLPAGRLLLLRTFELAEDKSLSLLLISSLKDAALFLRENETLFCAKVKEVTIMGGVTFPVEEGCLMEPDSAHNNIFDKEGSAFFYRRCQELEIPLVVVGRHAAYACPIGREVYDMLGETGSPIGWRLRIAQRSSIESLWKRAASPDPAVRLGLPARCDVEWFKKTFCGSNPELDNRGPTDPIWDLVTGFNMYDSLALLAAVPALRQIAFTPIRHKVRNVEHLIIGPSAEQTGFSLNQVPQCLAFLKDAYHVGLALNHHHKTFVILSMTLRPAVSFFMGLAVLASLVAISVVECLGIIVSSEDRYVSMAELEERAAEMRAFLQQVGLHSVQVSVQHASLKKNCLEEIYLSAPNTGVSLLVLNALTEPALFMMSNPELFRNKTLSVGVLGDGEGNLSGGQEARSQGPQVRGGGMFTLDMSIGAAVIDPNSAQYFVRQCQEMGVPLTVVSKKVFFTSRVPRSILDILEAKGGKLGSAGVSETRKALAWFHQQAALPLGHPDRKVPADCNLDWFCQSFSITEFDSSEPAWPQAQRIRADLPLLLMTVLKPIWDRFFSTQAVPVRGATHRFVLDVRSDEELEHFLVRLIFKGVLMNQQDYSLSSSVDVPGLGAIDASDSVPAFMSISQALTQSVDKVVNGTFLSHLMHGVASAAPSQYREHELTVVMPTTSTRNSSKEESGGSAVSI